METRGHLSLHQLKIMSAIEHCRTAVLGGHVEACTDCGHWRIREQRLVRQRSVEPAHDVAALGDDPVMSMRNSDAFHVRAEVLTNVNLWRSIEIRDAAQIRRGLNARTTER